MMDPKNPLTPGVYIQELNAFPNSIVEVATAVPVFIGYTQKADYNGENLLNKPVMLTSMTDYINFFGGGPNIKLGISAFPSAAPTAPAAAPDFVLPPQKEDFSLNIGGTVQHYSLSYLQNSNYYLYNSLQLFYQNGGGKCYIVSVGNYSTVPNYADLDNGLNKSTKETEITMISIPDSLLLAMPDYNKLNGNILQVCNDTQRTFALFDIKGGETFKDADYLKANASNNIVAYFRDQIGTNYLEHGAAYFPWLQTAISDNTNINISNFDLSGFTTAGVATTNTDQFYAILQADLKAVGATMNSTLATPATDDKTIIGLAVAKLLPGTAVADPAALTKAHNALIAISPNYVSIVKAAVNFINVLPATPAIAGIYTAVDNNRGVWKAPANVSVSAVVKPLYNFTDDEQGAVFNLNVDPIGGKSINIVRSFPGIGTMVWGARTLDGNGQDWKYVNVRRTMTMIEQSVKLAARAYVFEPNVANTWVTIELMLGNFLNGLWKQGALAGAVPTDAYSVNVGLGTTMSGDDILNGIMRIVVLVAISHPAEFLIFTFQQQMQKS